MAIKLDNIPGMESIFQGQEQQEGSEPSNPIANSVVTHVAGSNPPVGAAGGASAESPAQPSEGPKRRSYVQMIHDLMPEWDPEKMKADIEADKKRKKRQAIFAAIGDGVSALSNLFTAANGAPSMFDASKGMTAAHNAYWDKVKAERDKNRQLYLNAYLTAAGMDDAETERSWKRENTEKQQKFDNDLKTKQDARAGEMHTLQKDAQQLKNEAARFQNDHLQELYDLDVKSKKADIANKNASTSSHYANAAKTRAEKTFTDQQKATIYELAKTGNVPVYVNLGNGTYKLKSPEQILGELKSNGVKIPPSLGL